MPEKIPPEERLLNLVVALIATEQGLTKQAILTSVSGYREGRDSGVSQDALERMFERDKENLRSLGAPIETIGDFADPDDLREARYRIPKAEYELPEDIEFTPSELAVLNLAGGVWSRNSMSTDAQAGLRKLRALGNTVDEPIIGFAPRVSVRDASFPALRDAIEGAFAVDFDYLKPGEESPRRRRFWPLALIEFEARWHVYGVDPRVDAERTFLLSRIVGDVSITGEGFDPALREGAGERGRQGLEAHAQRNIALLELNPGTEAALRLGRRGTAAEQGIHVPFVDVHVFADELASFGPEVRVVEPAQLRDEVIGRLERTLALHTESAR